MTALLLILTGCGASAALDAVAEVPEPTATEVPPPTATEVPPPTATEVPPPTATEVPPPTATEVPPPTATAEPADSSDGEDDHGDHDHDFDDSSSEEDPADAGEPVTPDADALDPAIVDGDAIFAGSCASCHGAEGGGSDRGPSIVGIGVFFVDDAAPITGLVTNGGVNMPAFNTKLSPEQIDAVVTYVVETFQ